MINRLLHNTRSMTGRLAVFFTLLSIAVGALCLLIITSALYWSEDRVGERRIMIDRETAIELFQSGQADGQVRLDPLTVAYNSFDLLPEWIANTLQGRDEFLAEIGHEPNSRMVYLSEYTSQGQRYPLILVSLTDRIEITAKEFVFVVALVLTIVALLILLFGSLLYRISQTLIEPVNQLHQQLVQHAGDTSRPFHVNPQSADEFHLLADKLNHYRVQTEQLIKREQAFARYASHELRTPLTVIKGSANLLQRSVEKPFELRQLQRVQDASQQMSDMVDALLSLVRYERNPEQAEVRQLSSQELQAIVHREQKQADDKQLALSVSVSGEPSLSATPAVMTIVIGNLLRNAIAATERGEITIQMTATQLSIIDQGRGLSEQYDEHGHGLGLLIVDEWCRRYGWDFSLSNHADQGCIATITFHRI